MLANPILNEEERHQAELFEPWTDAEIETMPSMLTRSVAKFQLILLQGQLIRRIPGYVAERVRNCTFYGNQIIPLHSARGGVGRFLRRVAKWNVRDCHFTLSNDGRFQAIGMYSDVMRILHFVIRDIRNLVKTREKTRLVGEKVEGKVTVLPRFYKCERYFYASPNYDVQLLAEYGRGIYRRM